MSLVIDLRPKHKVFDHYQLTIDLQRKFLFTKDNSCFMPSQVLCNILSEFEANAAYLKHIHYY
ncbi:hypothetical protein A0J61_01095 [Choanephora cucurbitarum]|uniref:Uncharacterized protein n=1 Tax=Choanephora cucurbitarum TaxID=101091 RepID=A0A1C7NPD5_9FUNG|nr:hypothetical protein A0J61_01095 [Choanephora cucurbitarum]